MRSISTKRKLKGFSCLPNSNPSSELGQQHFWMLWAPFLLKFECNSSMVDRTGSLTSPLGFSANFTKGIRHFCSNFKIAENHRELLYNKGTFLAILSNSLGFDKIAVMGVFEVVDFESVV